MAQIMADLLASRCTSCLLFFFSSRRRHTRSVSAFLLSRSSDLFWRLPLVPRNGCGRPGRAPERFLPLDITSLLLHVIFRSEERRVGKECRSRGWPELKKKKSNRCCNFLPIVLILVLAAVVALAA